jgi:hypothetical protein
MRRNGTRHFKLRATSHAAGGPQLRVSGLQLAFYGAAGQAGDEFFLQRHED